MYLLGEQFLESPERLDAQETTLEQIFVIYFLKELPL